MKTVPIYLCNPLAEDFQKGIEKMIDVLSTLAKNGLINQISISFDKSREYAIMKELEKNGVPVLNDDDMPK